MPHTPLPKITLLKTNSITQCNDKADNLQDKLCGKVKPFMPYTHTHIHSKKKPKTKPAKTTLS